MLSYLGDVTDTLHQTKDTVQVDRFWLVFKLL